MNPRSAAQRCDVAATAAAAAAAPATAPWVCPEPVPSGFQAGVDTAICAMFWAKRSRSPWSSSSRRFMAPGRLFMLFRRMTLTWSLASVPAVLPCCEKSPSGSAAASESSVATSFLFGRRRRGFLVDGLAIFDIRAACLMCRLSLFVAGKSEEPEEAFFRADFSGLGAFGIGA